MQVRYFLQKKGWLGVNAFPPKISEREYKNSFFNCNNEHKEIMKKSTFLIATATTFVKVEQSARFPKNNKPILLYSKTTPLNE